MLLCTERDVDAFIAPMWKKMMKKKMEML